MTVNALLLLDFKLEYDLYFFIVQLCACTKVGGETNTGLMTLIDPEIFHNTVTVMP